MAESTASLKYSDLQRIVGRLLRIGLDPDDWHPDEVTMVADIINEAVRRFYTDHEWSFRVIVAEFVAFAAVAVDASVTVTASTTTVTASAATFYPAMIGRTITITDIGTAVITAYTSSTVVTVDTDVTCSAKTFSIAQDGGYRLPDDFGGIEDLSFASDAIGMPGIDIQDESTVRNYQALSQGETTGRPRIAAVRPLDSDGTTGQRFDLLLWPQPDQVYTLDLGYEFNPDLLSGRLYPLGGLESASALQAACKAQAELDELGEEGPHARRYATALAAAIKKDNKRLGARNLGYCGERNARRTGGRYRLRGTLVTYDNTLWTGDE